VLPPEGALPDDESAADEDDTLPPAAAVVGVAAVAAVVAVPPVASEALREPVTRAVSHCGTVRKRNEDAYVSRPDIGLWAVADGAGGHGAGDVASAAAVAALADLPVGLSAAEVLAQVRLRLGAVHTELHEIGAASAQGRTPATTVVVLLARGEHFACLWAGDSRAYLMRGGTLSQVTRDHSLVQELVDAGALPAEDAESHPQANVITRAVGSDMALELDKVSGRIQTGDKLLLCTDGLFKALSEVEIAEVLAAGAGPDELLQMALEKGARDNVTAVVVNVAG
jgi:serine/threonine protein phosphatase PrpC